MGMAQPAAGVPAGRHLASIGRGYAFRAATVASLSASAIPVLGVAWAAFWTGFLRVGAQSALLLAPLAAALLVGGWYTWLRITTRRGSQDMATLPRSLQALDSF